MVYIDNMNAPYCGMIMNHMVADTQWELLLFAEAIGVHWKWIQYPCSPREHFDISLAKKKLALQLGAKDISNQEMGMIFHKRKVLKYRNAPRTLKELLPLCNTIINRDDRIIPFKLP